MGIVNGTTNYILTRMDEEGADYADVLADAQRLGYAEADPTADVAGLTPPPRRPSSPVWRSIPGDAVRRTARGSRMSAPTMRLRRAMGYVIKLLAIADLTSDGSGICVRVHPTMVPRTHPLAAVRGAFNAVFVEAEAAGQVMFYGQGAGGEPTASAVPAIW